MGQNQRKHWLQFFAVLMVFISTAVNGVEQSTVRVVPDDHSLFSHAVNLSEQGKWLEAARLFTAIAARHPAWPEPKNNLAVAMLNLGKMDLAQQALEDAVGSQPSFRTAQDNRQRLYDYLAAIAYDRALGKSAQTAPPKLDLLTRLALPEPSTPMPARPAPVKQAPVKPAPVKPAPVKPAPVMPAPVKQVPTQLASASPTHNPAKQVSATIRQRLLAWSRAWSAADVDAYLATYSRHFKPASPETDYNEWRNIRRARLTIPDNTRVELDNIHIYLDQNNARALAEFEQSYRSDHYHDRVVKQLQLTLEQGQWLIVSERVIEKLN